MKDIVKSLKESYGKKNLVQTFSSMAVANPIMSNIEVNLGMQDLVSLQSRFYKTGLTYLILPPALWGREKLKQLCGITKESSEKIKFGFDAIYGTSIGALTSMVSYLQGGESDIKKIGGAIGLGMFTMPIIGWVVDTYNHITEMEKSKRKLPHFLENPSLNVKKAVTMGLMLSMLSTPLAYTYTKDTSISDKLFEYKKDFIEYVCPVEK